MRLIPLGTNGYMPSGGRQTMCFLVLDAGTALVLDAGTGLARLLEPRIAEHVEACEGLDLVLTHFHLDHTVGLSYLPGLVPSRPVRIHAPGPPLVEADPAEALCRLIHPPLFPVALPAFPMPLELIRVTGESHEVGGLHVRLRSQTHPGGSVGLRIGDRLAYVTDTVADDATIGLVAGVEMLLHEVWTGAGGDPAAHGHSAADQVARIAREAGVGRLMPVHLHPARSPAELDALAREARRLSRRYRRGRVAGRGRGLHSGERPRPAVSTETIETGARPTPATGSAATDRPAEAHRQATRSVGFWLYAAHLFAVPWIALSNILIGLSILAVPFPRGTPGAGGLGAAVRSAWRRGRPLLLVFAAYVALLLVSIAFSLDRSVSSRSFAELFNLSVLPLALMLVRGEQSVRRIVDGIVFIAGFSGLYGMVQYVAGYDDLSHRIHGSFSHYMTFSGVLLVADMLLLAQVAGGRVPRGWRGAWRWVALVAINASLVASFTRSAWVGLAVAFVLLALLRAPRWLVAFPVVALVLVLLAPRPVLERVLSITDLHDPSNSDRLSMVVAGLSMIEDRPLVGLGPDMVKHLYPEYRRPWATRLEVPHLHDSFLELAAERGLPELAAYLALTLLALGVAWRRWLWEGRFAGPRADLLTGVVVALVAFNVAGLFENNWGDTEVQRLALFLLALPFCLRDPEPDAG